MKRVSMTAEQAEEIDKYIRLLMKANYNKRAAVMMDLSNQYRFAADDLPENVIPLDTFSRRIGA